MGISLDPCEQRPSVCINGVLEVVVVVSEALPKSRDWVVTAYVTRRIPEGDVEWEAKLTFKYDRQGDILYINKTLPYAEQESEELGDEVIARLNPKTGEIENIEVLFFSTRLLRSDLFELPDHCGPPVSGKELAKIRGNALKQAAAR